MNELNLYGLLSPEEMNALAACMCVANLIGTKCQVSKKPFDFQLLEEDGKIIFESVCVMFADEARAFIDVNDDGSLELEFQCYTDGDPREGETFYKLNIGIDIASKTEILGILNNWGAPLK